MTKFKNSKFDKTQNVTKNKIYNCDKTQNVTLKKIKNGHHAKI